LQNDPAAAATASAAQIDPRPALALIFTHIFVAWF
jgi:hypothetical protein